ncbi:E3 ubiquitin-protein ligase TRIM31-like [Ochotona princeps]|uniref:E3 ubiquitin-protein ligase TRIM31-like n=1 Tax=Ochotona princeps TaxID=9978 RepID=UPI00271559EF|nr:E3 ubiquitin-protein ligase TRIM31-like [Ochotona princeps]
MASQHFSNDLQQEVTCPICLDILQEPVTIGCGHSFCQCCISRIKEASGDDFKCPLCKCSVRKDTFIPNWQLRNLLEKIGRMGSSEMKPEEEELRCSKHGEKLHYFCEEDGELLCVVCRDSKDHKSHNASVMKEAAQHHQEQIQVQVAALQQKEQELVRVKAQDEKKISNFMAQVESEKQRIHTEFKDLQQVLEERKSILLSSIEWLAQEGTKECERCNADTQAKLSSLKDALNSLKVKQQMPPRQLLQDIKGTLQRCEKVQFQLQRTTPIPLELEKKLNEAKSRHDSIIKSLKKFGGVSFICMPQH